MNRITTILTAVAVGQLLLLSPATAQIKLTVVHVDSEETRTYTNKNETGWARNAVDGNPKTFWHTQWQDSTPDYPHEIVIELTPPATIQGVTYLPRQDNMDHGNIKDYEIYLSDDTVEFGDPVAKGSFSDNKAVKMVAFEPHQCRYVKLRALSEIKGNPWACVAEIGVIPVKEATAPAVAANTNTNPSGVATSDTVTNGTPVATGDNAPPPATPATNQIKLTAIQADSEELLPGDDGHDGRAGNAVDGDPKTFWHTQWANATPDFPHSIIIELSEPATIQGVTYLPRQDTATYGNIQDYEIYLSEDGKDFGQPVAKGTFASGHSQKTVTFEPRHCHYLKLRALSEVNGGPAAAAAEIGIIR